MSDRPVIPDLTKVDIAAAYKWALEDRQWLDAENALYRQSFKRIGEWLSKTGYKSDVYIWMGRDGREAIDAALYITSGLIFTYWLYNFAESVDEHDDYTIPPTDAKGDE